MSSNRKSDGEGVKSNRIRMSSNRKSDGEGEDFRKAIIIILNKEFQDRIQRYVNLIETFCTLFLYTKECTFYMKQDEDMEEDEEELEEDEEELDEDEEELDEDEEEEELDETKA